MFPVSIRYKNLTKIIPPYQFHNLFYTRSIQLIKNII